MCSSQQSTLLPPLLLLPLLLLLTRRCPLLPLPPLTSSLPHPPSNSTCPHPSPLFSVAPTLLILSSNRLLLSSTSLPLHPPSMRDRSLSFRTSWRVLTTRGIVCM